MVNLTDPKMFSTFVQSSPAAVIHFWAGWNASDYQMKEKLKDLEISFSETVGFGAVDVDNEKMIQLAIDLKIVNVPTLIYYKSGGLIEMIIGFNQPVKEKLNSLFE